jgi:hypothetical protein
MDKQVHNYCGNAWDRTKNWAATFQGIEIHIASNMLVNVFIQFLNEEIKTHYINLKEQDE